MGSNVPLRVYDYVPETYPRRVLLCNPPIYDTRFPWARFQQPVTLLQLSTLLKRLGCDVRILDALHTEPNTTLRRRRMRVLTRDDIPLNWWRLYRGVHHLLVGRRGRNCRIGTKAIPSRAGASLWSLSYPRS